MLKKTIFEGGTNNILRKANNFLVGKANTLYNN